MIYRCLHCEKSFKDAPSKRRKFCSRSCQNAAHPDRRTHATAMERIVDRVSLEPSGCWRWLGRVGDRGYGWVYLGQASGYRLAHRVAYEEFVGEVPRGLELDHLCRNRACVNPNHLEPVTHRENCQRGADAKTHCANGHPFNAENTRHTERQRVCRICANERNAAYRRRLKVEASAIR